MDDSYFEAELIEQFRLAEADYSICACTDTREGHGDKILGGEIETIETSDNDSEDEQTESDAEATAERCQDFDVSLREDDEKEARLIDLFIAEGCKCSLGPKKQHCSQALNRETIMCTRNNCLEMSTIELDMLVLANLDAHRHKNVHTSKSDNTKRTPVDYYFGGNRVCKETFLFVHEIGPKRYKNLVAHFDKNGLISRMHGNTKRLPANTTSLERTKSIYNFIKNFSTIHALPLPGRLPHQFSDEKALLLPTHMTKRFVYREYCMVCTQKGEKAVSRRKFEDLWSELLPHIANMKPATDLCDTCQNNIVKVMRSVNLPDADKSQSLKEAEVHLLLAKQERELYNTECMRAAEEVKIHPLFPEVMHLSFDFAQQIHFPNSPQQVGPLYFLTPRKCQLFGICSEGHAKRVNYLIDENDSPGKGANCVISMLHHYLESKTNSNQDLLLHADNAVGQNKNNAMIQYCAWRVFTGKSQTIKLSFMIAGHTKFSPDRFFGLIKKSYRQTSVSTLYDIEKVVNASTTGGQNSAISTVDIQSGERNVHWYNWSDHLGDNFRSIPMISKYHHFRIDKTAPGVVMMREYVNTDETKFTIVKKTEVVLRADNLPSVVTPTGMSTERQLYLYEKIRRYCASERDANLTCPFPTTVGSVQSQAATKVTTMSTRLCSHCRKPGHTKTVRGVLSCPELINK